MMDVVDKKLKDSYKDVELVGLPPSFFQVNRDSFYSNLKLKLKNYEQDSVFILEGGVEVPRFDTDVVAYLFLQEAYFYYLTGVRKTDFYAVLDLMVNHITLFWKVPPESTKIWSYVPSLESLTKKYDIEVKDFKDFYKFLGDRHPKKIYLLNGTNSDSKKKVRTATLDFPPPYKDMSKLVESTDKIYEILADTRTRKSPQEIDFMSYLNDLTAEAHMSVMKLMKTKVKYERDMESIFFDYISTNYYTRYTSYQSICGSGINSKTLHYDKNDVLVPGGCLNLIDMGAKIAGYSTDITSTIPMDGKYNFVQRSIYNLVLKSNLAVQENMKPGVWWPDMQLLAESVILDGLQELGLLKDGYSVEQMLKDRTAYYFMPHGLGHFLGLEEHDVGGYLSFTPPRINELGLNFLRTARHLEENNVITVEPGIYFIEFHLNNAFKDPIVGKYFNVDLCKSFLKFGGVRIEDNILVTKDGSRNLTSKLPRKIEDIEAIINS